MKIIRNKIAFGDHFLFKQVILLIILVGGSKLMLAQCPPNIDFEQGDFTGWQCWIGHTSSVNNQNIIKWDVPPANTAVDPALYPDRFKILSAFPGDGLDEFGQFPVNCPNGSGHSIKLGNTGGNHQAEGISYIFTIPAGQNTYNLIYNYAVVFQGPIHPDWEQPRMVIEIKDITDNRMIDCSSFNFFYSNSSPTLPGFFLSTNNNTGTPVWCKNWTAASIKLDSLAGKTIQLFFKTADCIWSAHFGYAYIDVNTECSSSFTGATYCPEDTMVKLTAPFGYEHYTWWNAGFTTVIGNTQTVNFSPPPASGSTVAVVLDPYNGFGCRDTLYARLFDTLTVQSFAGPDQLSCNNSPVQLGANSRPGLIYSWSPATGLSDPNISNPVATTSVTTQYVLTTSNSGGGCATTDTVLVTADVIDTALQIIGTTQFCNNGTNNAILKVQAADSIQWFKDNQAIPGANDAEYHVTETGDYHAVIFNSNGCSLSTSVRHLTAYPLPDVRFEVNKNEQCFTGNQFVFTNASTIAAGNLQYAWELGDGTSANTTDVMHRYTLPGDYRVKLISTSANGCIDSTLLSVKVYPYAQADFAVSPVCINLNLPLSNKTINNTATSINYLWDFGNGQTSTERNPVFSYTQPGKYTVKLSVNTDECPLPVTAKQFEVQIDAPEPGVTYMEKEALMNYPELLRAREIGNSALWSPSFNLDYPTSYNPNFKGINSQLYTVQLKTATGCVTVDTQMVKTHKKIEIFVPKSFTPDGNGLNDYLRPILMGFTSVNYFRVFNRWGKLLFQMQGDRPGWDGKVNGKVMDMQSVIWMIEAVDVDGIVHKEQGTSILLR